MIIITMSKVKFCQRKENSMIDWLQTFSLGYLALPFLGGLGVALVCGPLGSFMVWRRFAYFGDTLAHSGLLGVTLALILKINILIGVASIAVLIAMLLLQFQKKSQLAGDTILGLLSHATLAIGLLTLAMVESIRVDVLGFLYGDILAMTASDVWFIYGGGILVLGIMGWIWQPLLRITLHSDLAQVEGVPISQMNLVYVVLLAIVIAIAIKIVGVLLITSLLIIPAATARFMANSPEKMVGFASLLGMISVSLGMLSSHFWDVPTGPAIVVISVIFFILALGCKEVKSVGV